MIQLAAARFMINGLFPARFEQSRPKVTVNLDRTTDHAI